MSDGPSETRKLDLGNAAAVKVYQRSDGGLECFFP